MSSNSTLFVLLIGLLVVVKHEIECKPAAPEEVRPEMDPCAYGEEMIWDENTRTLRKSTDRDIAELAFRFQDEKKYREAIPCFDKAIRMNPDELSYCRERAKCLMKMGEYAQALPDLKKLAIANPENKMYRVFLFRAFFYTDDDQEKTSLQTLVLGTDSFGDLRQFLSTPTFREILTQYNELTERNRDEALFYRGGDIDYWSLRNTRRKKISQFEHRIEMFLHHVTDLQYHLFLSLLEAEKDEEAVIVLFGKPTRTVPGLDDARLLDPNNEIEMTINGELPTEPAELEIVANRLQYFMKYKASLLCYNKLLKMNPSSEAEYNREKGRCFMKLENFAMAVTEFEKLVQMDPDNINDRILLCRALFAAEEYDRVVKETFLLDHTAIAVLGSKLLSKKKYEEALLCYNEVIKRKPEETLYYKYRGKTHWGLGNLEEAIIDFQRMIEKTPHDLTGRQYLLAEALVEAKRYDDALEVLEYFEEKSLSTVEISTLRDKIHQLKRVQEVTARMEGVANVLDEMATQVENL